MTSWLAFNSSGIRWPQMNPAAPVIRIRMVSSSSLDPFAAERVAEVAERKDGSILADEEAAHLAVPTEAQAALHVALQRHPDAVAGDPVPRQRDGRGLHHPLGSTHEGDGRGAVPR